MWQIETNFFLLPVVVLCGAFPTTVFPLARGQQQNQNVTCDQSGYISCWDYENYYGNQTSLQMGCPGLSKDNNIHVDSYCVGFMAG